MCGEPFTAAILYAEAVTRDCVVVFLVRTAGQLRRLARSSAPYPHGEEDVFQHLLTRAARETAAVEAVGERDRERRCEERQPADLPAQPTF